MKSQSTFDPVARARDLAPLIRQHADAAERNRRLSPEVAKAMAAAGLYRIAAPERCGGSNADPMTQLATIEAVANADGSTGWNLMIGIESFGLIAPGFDQCADLLADPMVILCGSTAAVCTADETPNGWRVNGRWQFVSGSNNSQVFAGLVQRRRDGKPIEGMPPCLRRGDAAGLRGARHMERRRLVRIGIARRHHHRRRSTQRAHSGADGPAPRPVAAGTLPARQPARLQQSRRSARHRPRRHRRVRRHRHRQSTALHLAHIARPSVCTTRHCACRGSFARRARVGVRTTRGDVGEGLRGRKGHRVRPQRCSRSHAPTR